MSYLTQGQIQQKYDALGSDNKVEILSAALDIKESFPSKSKQVCIAMALGYNACISGSGFFEKAK